MQVSVGQYLGGMAELWLQQIMRQSHVVIVGQRGSVVAAQTVSEHIIAFGLRTYLQHIGACHGVEQHGDTLGA